MDVLWQRQRFLRIILQTLSADCWTITGKIYVSGNISRSSKPLILPAIQHVTRSPTTNEWEWFRRYAARVVQLFVGKTYNGSVWEASSENISFLGIRSTLDPLRPRLTTLRLGGGLGWDTVQSTLTFLSPKVTSLTLALPGEGNILLQLILSIASDRCHSLREFVLSVNFGDPDSANGVGRLISACRDTLRSLEIGSPCKKEYLPIIANLPHLRGLRLQGIHFPCDLPSNAFPSLEDITVLNFHGKQLPHFFSHLRTTGLEVVGVRCNIDAIAFKELMAALSRFSASLRTLKVLAVANLDLPNVGVPHPLFANLRYLRVGCPCAGVGLDGPCAFRPTDQAVAELGVAMPNIARLTLGSPTCPTPQRPTFLSLVSLSKTCRDLETLTIEVDFQTMVAPSLNDNGDVEMDATSDGIQDNPCKLHTLFVGLSALPDHLESGWIVAIGFGKLFPSLSASVRIGTSGRKLGEILGCYGKSFAP